jgi:hypothetical protein
VLSRIASTNVIKALPINFKSYLGNVDSTENFVKYHSLALCIY